jgi:hypothetical protein
MVAPLKETGDESHNEKGRYEGSSELTMLTRYYISCNDNDTIVKAGLVFKGKHKFISPLQARLQKLLVIFKPIQPFL